MVRSLQESTRRPLWETATNKKLPPRGRSLGRYGETARPSRPDGPPGTVAVDTALLSGSAPDTEAGHDRTKLVGSNLRQVFTLQNAEMVAPLRPCEPEASPRRRRLAQDIVEGSPAPVRAFAEEH